MAATAADYAWFQADGQLYLGDPYCLTLVRGLTPAEFMGRIGAREQAPRTGVDALWDPSMEAMSAEPMLLFIGVATVPGQGGDWAMAVELGGYLGATEEIIVNLSAGTRLVSHYSNSGADHFYWIDDRDLRLEFNPVEPAYREGSSPDALADVMREVGFDLSSDGDNFEVSHTAAFALAERLTGVRVTAQLLDDATYTCGIVPAPGHQPRG
jgi:Family of unknown function (DUF6461)